MKRITAALLVLLLILSMMSGCGKKTVILLDVRIRIARRLGSFLICI